MSKKTLVVLALAIGLITGAALVKASAQFNVRVNLGDEHHRHHHMDHHMDHPMIDAALGQLNQARGSLAHAAHDFGGHRNMAIRAVDNAIAQCNKALDYANTHDR